MESEQCCAKPGNSIQTTHSSCITNSICNESSRKEASVGSEAAESQKMYKCSLCNSTFFRCSHLRDHLNHHAKNRQYQCKEINCSKAYFSWKHLRRHLIDHHKLPNVKKSLYVKTESKRHKCLHVGCNAAFDRNWKLTDHMWKHTNEKRHPCTENDCNRVYASVGRLKQHIAVSHMPNNNKMDMHFICSEDGCKKVYKTVQSLRKHYMKHHKNDGQQSSPLNCTSCDKNFNSLKLLNRHRCLSYKCEECKSKFISVAALRRHMKKTHRFQTCSEPDCLRIFSKFSLLKEHEKAVHPKVFTCPTCNKKVSSRLKRHQQTHLLLEERRVFPCPYNECGRFYTTNFNLEQHIRSSHEGLKFHCDVPGCEKSLVTKQKLQEHMKLHDPLREPRQRKQMARRQRKDAGKPKRSMAAKLSGVSLSFREEQNVLCSVNNMLVNIQHTSPSYDTSESSDDRSERSDFNEELCEESEECEDLCDTIVDEPDISSEFGVAEGFDCITHECSKNSDLKQEGHEIEN